MADHAAKQTSAQSGGDLEMSDVRLLDEEDDFMAFGQSDLTSVLANPDFGRRRCTRILTYVKVSRAACQAGQTFFVLVLCVCRPWDKLLNFVQERPHPLFNVPAAGLVDQIIICSRLSNGCSTEHALVGPAGCALLAMLFLILFLVSALSSTGLKTDTGLSTDTEASNISGTANISTTLNEV